MLEAKEIIIDDVTFKAKIMSIHIAIKLKMKLAKEIAPVIMSIFKDNADIRQSADVLAEHLKAETVEGIIEVMTAYSEFNGRKLNPDIDFANRGVVFVWKCILHFLKTNFADVLEDPKMRSLIGGMNLSL